MASRYIVQQLRERCVGGGETRRIMSEAADEILQLRRLLDAECKAVGMLRAQLALAKQEARRG